jgi:PhoPQ-activated pathogenicity-related protein
MARPLALLALLLAALPARAGLLEYVQKPDDSFKWSVKQKTVSDSGTTYTIELTSQTWQGIKWDHLMVLYVPAGVTLGDTIVLYNDGGRPDPFKSLITFELSRRGKIPVACLYGIPNQPLFEGKKEDALIAETFVRFLATKDESWPLLFPMAKSLVRGMDAVQAFAKDELKTEVKSFVISGASKRGWTSWLTAVADPRVKAIAPMVIDMLNLPKQLPQQFLSFGKPSDMVKDYTNRGLIPIPKSDEAERLWKMVDPWMYRDKLTMPKMLVLGTNDPYWPQDALNLYWNDLKGDKWVLYVPNAGHDLGQIVPGTTKPKDRTRVVNTLAAYGRKQIRGEAMPKLTWKHEDAGDKLKISVTSDTAPKHVRVWTADAPTRDFRKAAWTEKPAALDKGTATAEVDRPTEGWRTFLAECEFEEDGLTYYLSTQLRMIEAGKK